MNNSKLKECSNCGSVYFLSDTITTYIIKNGKLESHGTEHVSENLICKNCHKEFDFELFDLEKL